MLLWLCYRPAAVAPIRLLAWEAPHATDVAQKKKKKKKKKRRKKKKKEKGDNQSKFKRFKIQIAKYKKIEGSKAL